MEEKHFQEWMGTKEKLHNDANLPRIKEGDVFWCGFGENVGVEINGKGSMFSRPVLVYKKLSSYGFIGIPLTSRPHEGSWYVQFYFRGKMENAVLAQVRSLSVYRLYTKIG